MANPFPSTDPADDPLALFSEEPDRPAPASTPARAPEQSGTGSFARPTAPEAPLSNPVAEFTPPRPRKDAPMSVGGAPADESGSVIYPTPSVLKKLAASVPESAPAPRDLAVEVAGPPPPESAISLDRIPALKGLGFVEGVALIQATGDAIAAAGESAGVPELHGLFLTPEGEVILHGPPTGDPPARELARLLHQLVTPNLMPPAGRLFIGRWINNDGGGLTEFASELAYFARPNSRELLGELYSRCQAVRPPAQVHRLEPRQKPAPPPQLRANEATPSSEQLPLWRRWMKSQKPALLLAAAVVIATITTAIVALLSNPESVKAKPPISSDEAAENLPPSGEPATNTPPPPITPATRTRASGNGVGNNGTRGGNGGRGSGGGNSGPSRRAAVVPPPLGRQRTTASQPSTVAIESQNAARGVPPEGPAAILPSRQAPDLRIYSANDSGVEPPRLRSAEIPELLIAGFEKRTNQVELVISDKGEVQQARMIGPPQRMPDIMLLSRAKELLFDPAVRNGVPVRYRLILSWNVTP